MHLQENIKENTRVHLNTTLRQFAFVDRTKSGT